MASLQVTLPLRLHCVCPGDATVQGLQNCPSGMVVGDTHVKCLCYIAHQQAHLLPDPGLANASGQRPSQVARKKGVGS